VLEDLNVSGMLKNHKLAGAISDASFGEIRRQLEYKTSWYGGEIIDVDRFFPSSKLCSVCGVIKEDLTLGDRIYQCECGNVIDRDLNAAINLEHYGLNTLGLRGIQACGESVRPNECCSVQEAVSMKQEENSKGS
jgi:putative transposase